jgi:hypothetical protein
MFEKDIFICIFNTDAYSNICILNCKENITYCNELILEKDGRPIFSDGIIYDTVNITIKVIIVKKVHKSLLWNNIYIGQIQGNFTLNNTYFELSSDYETLNYNLKDCDFNQFSSLYLFCCGCTNYIICTRFSNDFKTINSFKLNFNGTNSYVKIMDNRKHLSIFFINIYSGLYRINIHPQSCKNSTFDLEKEQEIEINFKELLYRKSDNNYYITFNKFDENRVNNSNINFTFILNNNSIFENNLIIIYKISIEDAYYDICSIELKIKNKDELNKCLLNNLDKDLKEEFIDEIINDVLSHIESPDIINCSDFMEIVFDINYENSKEQLNNGISAIDLGNCTNKIKEFYNIEDFIVLNRESKNNKNENENNNYIGKNNQIEIYNYTGKKLNLSICDENIKIMKYIGYIDEKIIESAKKFASQGIDIFNPKDKFFNDLCYYYDNKDGKDIIIKDRRNDIYQNITFCQDGCKYIGFDYELMIVNCSCDTNILENDDLYNIKEDESEIFNFDYLKKLFISNLFDFNYQIIYCYNLVFNLKMLGKNVGFFYNDYYDFSSNFILDYLYDKRIR